MRKPSVHEQLGRGMIELVGVQRLDQAEFVRHLLQVGEEVGHLDPRLAALPEGELVFSGSPQEIGLLADEGQFGGIKELIRTQLPVSLLELRLVVEEVEVGG